MRAAFPVRRDEKEDTRSQLAGRARLRNSPHDRRVFELLKLKLEWPCHAVSVAGPTIVR